MSGFSQNQAQLKSNETSLLLRAVTPLQVNCKRGSSKNGLGHDRIIGVTVLNTSRHFRVHALFIKNK